jgi:hypothetical protein
VEPAYFVTQLAAGLVLATLARTSEVARRRKPCSLTPCPLLAPLAEAGVR